MISKRSRLVQFAHRMILSGSMLLAVALVLPGCGDDDNCAVEQENCTQSYLADNGLSGCCDGLSCETGPISGVLICR